MSKVATAAATGTATPTKAINEAAMPENPPQLGDDSAPLFDPKAKAWRGDLLEDAKAFLQLEQTLGPIENSFWRCKWSEARSITKMRDKFPARSDDEAGSWKRFSEDVLKRDEKITAGLMRPVRLVHSCFGTEKFASMLADSTQHVPPIYLVSYVAALDDEGEQKKFVKALFSGEYKDKSPESFKALLPLSSNTQTVKYQPGKVADSKGLATVKRALDKVVKPKVSKKKGGKTVGLPVKFSIGEATGAEALQKQLAALLAEMNADGSSIINYMVCVKTPESPK
jgi:hypothetical protein